MKSLLPAWMLTFSMILLLSGTHATVAANPAALRETLKPDNTVEVYFFHRNRRCGPCTLIERNTKQTINDLFGEQVEKGEVTLFIVNTDKSENLEVAKKFNARSTALFVVSKNGQEEDIENLTMMAMRHARNENLFIEELSKSISACLSDKK